MKNMEQRDYYLTIIPFSATDVSVLLVLCDVTSGS